MMQRRCLVEINGNNDDEGIANDLNRQDDSLILDSLDTHHLGPSILTLEEALETVAMNIESQPFQLKQKDTNDVEKQ